MYERILVAVDHSELSDRAVLAARDLATLSDGEVWVLHLRERDIGFKTGFPIMEETTEQANAVVTAAFEVLTQAGVKAYGEVRDIVLGYAAGEIVDDAKEYDVDLIVMGSSSDLTNFILGTTTHKVLHLTDRPVLVIR
jgi:nucleotide-binding universal stress UspA family protein